MQYQGRTLHTTYEDTKTQVTMTDYTKCMVKEAMWIRTEPNCNTV